MSAVERDVTEKPRESSLVMPRERERYRWGKSRLEALSRIQPEKADEFLSQRVFLKHDSMDSRLGFQRMGRHPCLHDLPDSELFWLNRCSLDSSCSARSTSWLWRRTAIMIKTHPTEHALLWYQSLTTRSSKVLHRQRVPRSRYCAPASSGWPQWRNDSIRGKRREQYPDPSP